MEVAVACAQSDGLQDGEALSMGARAVLLVAEIAAIGHEHGFPVTQADHAEHIGCSIRTTERRWQDFKRGFPDEDGPDRLARDFAAAHGSKFIREGGAAAAVAHPYPALTTVS